MEKLSVYAQEAETKNSLGIRVISNIAVTVSTRDTMLAGTDAHVFLQLGDLGHDNTGKLPCWFVSGVSIQVKFAGSNMLALYKQWGEVGWLSMDVKPYFTTVAELQDGV